MKIEFKVASLKHIMPSINYFLNPKKEDWDWSGKILNKYPELNRKLGGVKEISKRKKIANDFFEEVLYKNEGQLEKVAKEFQREWDKINEKYIKVISEVLEIKWPKKDKKIIAFVSLNPICPRYIKKRIFDVYYLSDKMKEIAIHETLHFLYFEKWKQVFPKTKEREFDQPHLVWQLSEIVPKAILSDKRIQKVFEHKPKVYDEYMGMKINERPLLRYIGEFYYKRKNFVDFLNHSWEFVKKHEKEFKLK